MPVKSKKIFVCKDCGNESTVWQGQCRACGSWNSFYEQEVKNYSKFTSSKFTATKPILLKDISIDSNDRLKTGILELDTILGGGLVKGQVILLAGQPGIGKSTILLQIANSIKKKVLYLSGEESSVQIALRAKRLGVKGDLISINTNNDIGEAVSDKNEHALVIVDSIQTVYSDDAEGSAGSVMQIKECAYRLIQFAKATGIPVIIVGHITKEGSIAGPKLLEHMVDTVLYMEGDRQHMHRLIRIEKNRFGDDSEVGVFEMNQNGLQEISDVSQYFLNKDALSISGNAVAMVLEGNRPIAIDVQALTIKTAFGYPKRTANGFNVNKLHLIAAVFERHAKLNLSDQDIYINIASGLSIKEPGVDLAVCAAIESSFLGKPISSKNIFIGEIGLSGEVRKVLLMDRRIKEAKKLGYQNIITSSEVKNIKDLTEILR